MSLMAYEDYMQTGSLSIATELYDTILENTMINCVNNETQLVDFSNGCSRGNNVRDLTDWPAGAFCNGTAQWQLVLWARGG